jgi:hypothetical protein
MIGGRLTIGELIDNLAPAGCARIIDTVRVKSAVFLFGMVFN